MRAALPDELRAYMDGLGKDARTERIRLKRNVSADRGWAAMVSAAESALAHTGRVDEAGMAVAALRSESGPTSRWTSACTTRRSERRRRDHGPEDEGERGGVQGAGPLDALLQRVLRVVRARGLGRPDPDHLQAHRGGAGGEDLAQEGKAVPQGDLPADEIVRRLRLLASGVPGEIRRPGLRVPRPDGARQDAPGHHRGRAAVEAGSCVRFFTTAELVLQLAKAKRKGCLDRHLADIEKRSGYPGRVRAHAHRPGEGETAVPGNIELLREAQPDTHDEHRVQQVGDNPR